MQQASFPQLTEAEQNVRKVALILLKDKPNPTDTIIQQTLDFAKQAASDQPLDLGGIFTSLKLTVYILAAKTGDCSSIVRAVSS